MNRYRFFPIAFVLIVCSPAVAEPTWLNVVERNNSNQRHSNLAADRSTSDNSHRNISQWESHLVSDLADGSLDQHTLLEAGLIIGGVEDSDILHDCQRRWRHIADTAETQLGVMAIRPGEPHQSVATRSRQLLRFMHDQVLMGNYSETCNALDRTLLDGDYNCVTTTILYCLLARHCGLTVQPVSLPGHVCCRVEGHEHKDGSNWNLSNTDVTTRFDVETPFDVETTDADWQNESIATDEIPSSVGRVLTDVELLAKLFYNRGLAKLATQDFAAALAATELSWQLDHQHEAARENVATVINNWALHLTANMEFEQALSLLERGQQLVPDHPILYANQSHIRDAWSRHTTSLRP